MQKKIFDYFEIAARTAVSKDDERSFMIGSIAIRGDGVMVKALNGPSRFPTRQAHSEFRLSKKIDYGATIYVARVRLVDGEFGMSKPCPSCMKALLSKRVKKIYYTIGPNEFGIINCS
jgi:tRNA(Arg) A34 adenosine deaminase TadA